MALFLDFAPKYRSIIRTMPVDMQVNTVENVALGRHLNLSAPWLPDAFEGLKPDRASI